MGQKITELTAETALSNTHLLITQNGDTETKSTALSLLLSWLQSNIDTDLDLSKLIAGNSIGITKDIENNTATFLLNIPTWTSSTAYVVGDFVLSDNCIYRCNTAHTSSTSIDIAKFTQIGGGSGGTGTKWFSGETAPTSEMNTGDYWLSTTTVTLGNVYQYNGTDWNSLVCNIRGATGANGINGTNGVDGQDGQDGTNGIDGTDGAMWYAQETEPTSANENDLWLSTATATLGNVYQLTANATWDLVCNIKGSSGGATINDDTVSADSCWSSSKVDTTKQNKIGISSVLTLTSTGWDSTSKTQTVNVALDITKQNTINITVGELDTWATNKVYPTSESVTGIVFTCGTIPTIDLTFTVTSMEVG